MTRYTQWLMWLVVLLVTPLVHAGTKHYYYTDPQGTPLAKADASGNITARFEYTPYGVPVTNVGAAPDGVGYTGHVNDPETGLVYMQARYYDAARGGFISVDSATPSPGNLFNVNRYVYANNNPILNIDPDGNWPVPPLFHLDWFHSVVDAAFNHDVKEPLQAAYKAVDDNVVITHSLGGASVVGGNIEQNVLHPEMVTTKLIFGEGLNYSIDAAPKRNFTLNLGGNPSPSETSVSVSVEGGAILHGGLSLSLDAHGNLAFTPKVGFGVGELATANFAKAPFSLGPVEVTHEFDLSKKDVENN